MRSKPGSQRNADWRLAGRRAAMTTPHDPCPICGEEWSTCSHMLAAGPSYRGAVVCAQCGGDGDVASGQVDEDGDQLAPVLCPRCGGSGGGPGGGGEGRTPPLPGPALYE